MTLPLEARLAGCLLGGAIGDALGAPFEGLWARSIPEAPSLLGGFAEYEGYPNGQWTDDTQLTLATVEAILDAGDVDLGAIARRIARLWQRNEVIGPGGACTRAAWSLLRGTPWDKAGAPDGQAGNGTAMRTAFLGLLFLDDPEALSREVAKVSRITHQDSRSVAGGVAIAAATRTLALAVEVDAKRVCWEVAGAMRAHDAAFAQLVQDLQELVDAPPEVALPRIAWAGQAKPELQEPIITPFVVPTVLASLWIALRHPDDWGRAVARVIRLGGDVDTTGAIVGGMLGARLGVPAIPAHLAAGVVDAARIRRLAMELAAAVVDA